MINFAELNLIAPIQRALQEEKYHTPTPIQHRTIPEALLGRDILGCAQTGTGKTAAFALPLLNQLARSAQKAIPNRPLALVLAPTRELAIQISENCTNYGRHLQIRHAVIYGGVGQSTQVQALNRGLHLLIATPGRLLDLMQQGYLKLDQLQMFVLDEADRMMDMGFMPDLKRIIAVLPKKRQSLFFSATLPPEITKLAKQLLIDPVSVNVSPPSSTVELIDQRVMFVEKSQKRAALLQLLNSGTVGQILVFTQTKRAANMLSQQLSRHGINSAAIHGNKSQNARQRALDEFRSEKIQVLVATDLAARGLDVDGITHVVNFELPREPESYVHRIGRTGRAGETGIAISFCDSAERADLQAIQRLIGKKIPVVSAVTSPAESAAASRPVRRDRPEAAESAFGDGVFRTETSSAEMAKPGRRSDTGRPSGSGERSRAETPGRTDAPSRERRPRRRSGDTSSPSVEQRSDRVRTDAPRPDGQARRTENRPAAAEPARRPFDRRPNRKATEEYKAAGGRKAVRTQSQPESTKERTPDSRDSVSRTRSRRPPRRPVQ